MRTSRYKLVFVDIDGVIRNFIRKMKEVFREDFPDEQILREDFYDLRQWTSIKERIFPWVMESKSAEKIFVQAPEHPRSFQAFKGWLDKMNGGFPRFFIITHQSGLRVNWTRQWLQKRGILGKIPIYYTIDKPGVIKAVIEDMKQRTGVEIRPADCVLLDDNISELEGALKIGVEAICIDRSWNQQWKGKRIIHLGEFDPFVKVNGI